MHENQTGLKTIDHRKISLVTISKPSHFICVHKKSIDIGVLLRL